MGNILKELAFVYKLKRSADRGLPLILVVRPDRTMDFVFPTMRRGNLVWYVDPATKRREIVIMRPEAIMHLGKAIILVHIQGFLENLGWKELGALLFSQPATVNQIKQRLLELIEYRHDSIPGALYTEYKERVTRGSLIDIADVWRELKAAELIKNIDPPEPPAILTVPKYLLSTLEDFRTAVLAESMSYIKQVTGLQGLLGGRVGWWILLLLLIGGGLLLLMLFGGAFHPAPAHPAPIKT